MPPLTKLESCYFIVFALIATALLLIAVQVWNLNPQTCWDKYPNEQQAIEHCEGIQND